MTAHTIHLLVEAGNDKGTQISVPVEGGRLGRSSKNDIVLEDPLLSRHHCRLFFKTGDGLWITDLGSANGTLLNNVTVQEKRLRVGDLLQVGDTVLRVLNDQLDPVADTSGQQKIDSAAQPDVDLGLNTDSSKPKRKPIGLTPLLIAGGCMILLAIVVWIPRLANREDSGALSRMARWILRRNETNEQGTRRTYPKTLEVTYEKIDANTDRIFRYALGILPDNSIWVELDDTENNRHIPRRRQSLDKDYVSELTDAITNTGFFNLESTYKGFHPDVYEVHDITITVGPDTHRVRVENHIEPEAFEATRNILEACAQNTFDEILPMPYSTDELIEMARDANVLGQRLFTEREIKYENLAKAVRQFNAAQLYIESIEPKPDFYPEIISGLSQAKEALQAKYEEHNYGAQHARRLKDWDTAQRELQIILEIIPDNTDKRNKQAQAELLDVQTRMNM